MAHDLNVALKTAIFQSGKQQQRIASLAGLTPWELSFIVRGRRQATEKQRKRLARVLGKSEAELFPGVAEAVVS